MGLLGGKVALLGRAMHTQVSLVSWLVTCGSILRLSAVLTQILGVSWLLANLGWPPPLLHVANRFVRVCSLVVALEEL